MIDKNCVHCSKAMNGGVYRKPNQCPHCFKLQDETLTARCKPRPGFVKKARQVSAKPAVKKKATFAANSPSAQMEVSELLPETFAKVVAQDSEVKSKPKAQAKSRAKTQAKTQTNTSTKIRVEPKLDLASLSQTKQAASTKQTPTAASKTAQANTSLKIESPSEEQRVAKKINSATEHTASNDDVTPKPSPVKVDVTEAGEPFHPLYLERKPCIDLSLDIHLQVPAKKAAVLSMKAKTAKAKRVAQKATHQVRAAVTETAAV